MSEYMTLPIPEGLESYFQDQLVPDGDHVKWRGLKALPTGRTGFEMPMIEWDLKLWRVGPLAWAIAKGQEYPCTWYQNDCGDKECVRAEHIKIISPRRAGRRALSIEETEHYAERYALIKRWLSEDENTLMFEIMSLLRENDLGGKNVTVSKIVAQVRAELGLKSRVPSRRKKTPQCQNVNS